MTTTSTIPGLAEAPTRNAALVAWVREVALLTQPDRRPNGPRGTPAPWQARRRPRTEAREAADRALY